MQSRVTLPRVSFGLQDMMGVPFLFRSYCLCAFVWCSFWCDSGRCMQDPRFRQRQLRVWDRFGFRYPQNVLFPTFGSNSPRFSWTHFFFFFFLFFIIVIRLYLKLWHAIIVIREYKQNNFVDSILSGHAAHASKNLDWTGTTSFFAFLRDRNWYYSPHYI